ncbi:MAG: hypothetical protein IJG07_10520 [Prevotella sp.]|nr:hypothetical protein [Prevotella sp.]
MEYKRLDEDWREAEKAGDIGDAIDLVEEQITENLLTVRNAFADDIADDPDAAFGFLFNIDDIKLEYQDVIEEFYELGEKREDVFMDRETASDKYSEQDFLERYVTLEEKTIDAMKKYDNAHILRELCRTVEDKVGNMRIHLFGLWLDKTHAPREIDNVLNNYARIIQLGGDPVVFIETIQAKLRAIRERFQSDHVTAFEEAEEAMQELLSIFATMEGIFRKNDCDMKLLEKALSKYTLYKGNCRQTDMESVHNDPKMLEGDPIERIRELMKRVWQRIESLRVAVETIGTTAETGG